MYVRRPDRMYGLPTSSAKDQHYNIKLLPGLLCKLSVPEKLISAAAIIYNAFGRHPKCVSLGFSFHWIHICVYMHTQHDSACVCICCSLLSLERMPLIMMMLTSTLPLLVSELSLDTNFLVGSQTQICLCSCTVTLSSLVTFIQCDTETSVTSTTVSFIPLGNE